MAHGFFWSLTGTVASRFFVLGATVITARLLGKAGYGELGMIQSTIIFMGTFAGLCMGTTTTKYVAELKEKDSRRAGRIIALTNTVGAIYSILMAVICLLAAPWLAQKIINAPHLATELRLGAATLIVSVILGVQTGTLSGLQNFKAIARINIYQGLVSLPCALILVYFWGLKGAVLSIFFPVALGVWLSSRVIAENCVADGIRIDYRGSWSERRVLWDFSLPSLLSGSLFSPVSWAANAILVNQPHGYVELGLFNAANQFRMLIIFLPNIIGMVTIPLLSEIHGQNNPAYFAHAVNANLRTVWGLAIPLGFVVIGLSSWLISIYGPEFQGGRTILALMACVAIMYIASSTVAQALIGSGKMWACFFLNLGWALIFLPLAAHWTPSLGAAGLAQAYFISYVCLTVTALLYVGVKFGRIGVQYSPYLILFTCMTFILSLSIGRLPEHLNIAISLSLACITAIWGWGILPSQGKEKIIRMIGL